MNHLSGNGGSGLRWIGSFPGTPVHEHESMSPARPGVRGVLSAVRFVAERERDVGRNSGKPSGNMGAL